MTAYPNGEVNNWQLMVNSTTEFLTILTYSVRIPMYPGTLPFERGNVVRAYPAGGVASLLAEHAGPDAEVAVSLHLHLLVALLLQVNEQVCGSATERPSEYNRSYDTANQWRHHGTSRHIAG